MREAARSCVSAPRRLADHAHGRSRGRNRRRLSLECTSEHYRPGSRRCSCGAVVTQPFHGPQSSRSRRQRRDRQATIQRGRARRKRPEVYRPVGAAFLPRRSPWERLPAAIGARMPLLRFDEWTIATGQLPKLYRIAGDRQECRAYRSIISRKNVRSLSASSGSQMRFFGSDAAPLLFFIGGCSRGLLSSDTRSYC